MADPSEFRIAMVAAQWHGDLVNIATDSCYSALIRLGLNVDNNVELFKVPGSLELPFIAKLLAQKGDWDAVIAFGLVVDGGIYRHEFVAQAVVDGLVKAALDTGVPILSTVLTPQDFDERDSQRIQFFRRHLLEKGVEAANATVETIRLTQRLST